jgi:hypothetical protein
MKKTAVLLLALTLSVPSWAYKGHHAKATATKPAATAPATPSRLLKNGNLRREALFQRCSGSASTGISDYVWRL